MTTTTATVIIDIVGVKDLVQTLKKRTLV